MPLISIDAVHPTREIMIDLSISDYRLISIHAPRVGCDQQVSAKFSCVRVTITHSKTDFCTRCPYFTTF